MYFEGAREISAGLNSTLPVTMASTKHFWSRCRTLRIFSKAPRFFNFTSALLSSSSGLFHRWVLSTCGKCRSETFRYLTHILPTIWRTSSMPLWLSFKRTFGFRLQCDLRSFELHSGSFLPRSFRASSRRERSIGKGNRRIHTSESFGLTGIAIWNRQLLLPWKAL